MFSFFSPSSFEWYVLTSGSLDGKGVFRRGLLSIRKKLEERAYPSISVFSAELASVFTSEIGVQPAGDTAELQMQISGRAPELSLEQREKRTLAKRIIKAIQPALEDAIMKESELNRKPFENELKELDHIFEFSVGSRRNSVSGSAEPLNGVSELPNGTEKPEPEPTEPKSEEQPAAAEESEKPDEDQVMTDADAAQPTPDTQHQDQNAPAAMDTSEDVKEPESQPEPETDAPNDSEAAVNGDVSDQQDMNGVQQTEMQIQPQPQIPPRFSPTPLLGSPEDRMLPLAQGGIQWYMEPFDPVGTTIHEERWTGRDVMRGMSEELSELDEDELEDLMDDETGAKPAGATKPKTSSAVAGGAGGAAVTATAADSVAKDEEKPESTDNKPGKGLRTRQRTQRYNFG